MNVVNAAVVLRPDETLEDALRRFKRAFNHSGVMAEVKRREIYITPAQRDSRKALPRIGISPQEASAPTGVTAFQPN